MINFNAKNQIGFKSQHLYDVKICDGKELISASFTQLHPETDVDKKAIEEIENKWRNTTYAKSIANFFLGKVNPNMLKDDPDNLAKAKYYALELNDPNQPSLSERIKGLAMCSGNNSSQKLNFLQVSKDSIRGSENRQYKHVGKMMMYGIIKKALDNKINSLKTKADIPKKGFYEDLGFEKDNEAEVVRASNTTPMKLEKDKFKDCLNLIEEDHNLEFTA